MLEADFRAVIRTLALVSIISLAACGGGSKQPDSGPPAQNPPVQNPPPANPPPPNPVPEPPLPTAALERNTVDASAAIGEEAPRASFKLLVHLSDTDGVRVRGRYGTTGISSIGPGQQSYNPGTYSNQITYAITYRNPAEIGAGTYDDTITLDVCADSACTRPLEGSPFTVTSRYVVLGSRDPVQTPMPVLDRIRLSHNVVDAEYSRARDELVMVSTWPSHALHVYALAGGVHRSLALSKAPTAVSISPDGQRAAVGHDALISLVQLDQVGSASATTRLLNVSAQVFDIVLDGRGYVHVFPRIDQWVNAHSVHIDTNVETLGTGLLRAGSRARLHPAGDFIYAADNGLSPSDIEKWDIRSGRAVLLYDSPYHGDYGMCGNLWFNESGSRIFTQCGNSFSADVLQAQDMRYTGRLSLSSQSHFVVSLDHSAARNQIAALESDFSGCSVFGSSPCFQHLGVFDPQFFTQIAMYTIPPMVVAGKSYTQRGRFVFFDSTGNRKLVLTQLEAMPDPASEFHLTVVE